MIENKIILKPGIDQEFINIMSKIYQPFINDAPPPDIAYTIYLENDAIPKGYIKMFQHDDSDMLYIHLALIPEMRNKNIGYQTIREIIDITNREKYGYMVMSNNLPSLKLLYKLNGILIDNRSWFSKIFNKYYLYEGFILTKNLDKSNVSNLQPYIKKAEKLYDIWLENTTNYQKAYRVDLDRLEEYLNRFIK